MKKNSCIIACLVAMISLLSSCKKENETRYVTLNESIQAGTLYSLDISSYGTDRSVAAITKQAEHYTVSRIDRDAATRRSFYHFQTDSKEAGPEKVVINVSGKSNDPCDHDQQKTIISIQFTVLP